LHLLRNASEVCLHLAYEASFWPSGRPCIRHANYGLQCSFIPCRWNDQQSNKMYLIFTNLRSLNRLQIMISKNHYGPLLWPHDFESQN
jgi:hypothetical protein